MIDIRLPNITGATEREQLQQTKSYLHQLVEQLNWALNNIDTQSNTAVVTPTARSLALVASGPVSQSDPQATFASIKSLIIKSAEIVEAYYDEINAELEGLYVAKSDFGEFEEYTKAQFQITSTGIEQTYTNIQAIYDPQIKETNDALDAAKTAIGEEVEGVKKMASDAETYIKNTKATIKTGILEEVGGKAIYGLEIGQIDEVSGEVNRRYARFTADELAFYDDNNDKVAWISGYQLHITDAVVERTIDIGGYRVDTTNGLAFKWVGGV